MKMKLGPAETREARSRGPRMRSRGRAGQNLTRAGAALGSACVALGSAASVAGSNQPSPGPVSYQGGLLGEGVITGLPKVYVVFWGSQWGTDTTTDGYDFFPSANDPSGASWYVESFLKLLLGSTSDKWDEVTDQYCEGVPIGSQSCPAGSQTIPFPTGGMFDGSWYDSAAPAPAEADGSQIADEATNAAAHFGNTTPQSNADTIYVIMSPHGTNPDNYKYYGQSDDNGFCAWHDSTLSNSIGIGLPSGGVPTPYGDLNFINLPYASDVSDCGVYAVNSGQQGVTDPFTILLGHEIAETLSDPRSSTGWIDASGDEIADKCAWLTPGTQGGMADLTVDVNGTVKSFAMQSLWSNVDNNCEMSGP